MRMALNELVREALSIWRSGGWGMVALALNGLVMYALGTSILLKLWTRGVFASPDVAWRKWRRTPERAHGVLSHIVTEAMRCRSIAELEQYFAGLRNDELAPFERDLRVMQVSVSAAPLLGLLGTVTGMLATFHALATGGGGDKTMGMVAGGISEALITTETGLVLALSGMIFQFSLSRQHARFDKNYTRLEMFCMQAFRGQESAPEKAVAV